jgi:hypothetical protein
VRLRPQLAFRFGFGGEEKDSLQFGYRIVGTPAHLHDPVIPNADQEPVSRSQPESLAGLTRNHDLVFAAELYGRRHAHLLPTGPAAAESSIG